MTSFKDRRQRLMTLMQEGIAIIPAATAVPRNNGNDYPFHQDPNFYYLTGSNEPGAILVLQKCRDNQETTLFVRPKNAHAEQWTGTRLGPEESRKAFGVDHARSLDDFSKQLPKLLKGHKVLFIDIFTDHPIRDQIFKQCRHYAGIAGPSSFVPQTVTNIDFLLGQMRLVKDRDEIDAIRKAVTISLNGYIKAISFCQPGRNEADIQSILECCFSQDGGSGSAYIPIVASGNRANIMHYIENNHSLNMGDLLLVDAGAEYNGIASDITRTLPVSGTFSPAQRRVYTVVLNALKAGIDAIAAGKTLTDIDKCCKYVLTDGLLDLGVLTGDLKEHIEKKSVAPYCPHSVCHWLGLNIHDRCARVDSAGKQLDQLKPGMIFTIEPGLYFQETDESVPPAYRGIGIRIEDDILITDDGFENLTECIGKEIEEIETMYSRPFSGLIN